MLSSSLEKVDYHGITLKWLRSCFYCRHLILCCISYPTRVNGLSSNESEPSLMLSESSFDDVSLLVPHASAEKELPRPWGTTILYVSVIYITSTPISDVLVSEYLSLVVSSSRLYKKGPLQFITACFHILLDGPVDEKDLRAYSELGYVGHHFPVSDSCVT